MVRPWAWPSPGSYLSQGFSRGGVGTSQGRLPPADTGTMALKPPFSSLHYCSEVPGPEASSPIPLPLTVSPPSAVFPTRGHRGVTLATPQHGDAHTWRRLPLATPKVVNLLTFSPRPLGGSHQCLTLTLVNTRGRDGTITTI